MVNTCANDLAVVLPVLNEERGVGADGRRRARVTAM